MDLNGTREGASGNNRNFVLVGEWESLMPTLAQNVFTNTFAEANKRFNI